jgi:carbonic anhydrase
MNPEAALRQLVEGNLRFVRNKLEERDFSDERSQVTDGQQPFAVIVGCSDSRVGPELVFDQGLGDLFVIRTAGHVVDEIALGSIQYAIEHLHVELVIVLGHEKCGAVTAAVEHADEEGGIAAIVKAIEPAVDETEGMPGDKVDNAVRANTKMVVNQLKADTILCDTKIIGARYDLDTGRVELL